MGHQLGTPADREATGRWVDEGHSTRAAFGADVTRAGSVAAVSLATRGSDQLASGWLAGWQAITVFIARSEGRAALPRQNFFRKMEARGDLSASSPASSAVPHMNRPFLHHCFSFSKTAVHE
eukprot:364950-Chlamydomonas_euryale.AAC.28